MNRLDEALATLIQTQANMQANRVDNDNSRHEIRKKLNQVIKF